MAVINTMIEEQLAAVANAMRNTPSHGDDIDRFSSLKMLMASWAIFARRSRDAQARERAWLVARSERLQAKSIVLWRKRARRGHMAMTAERVAREAMAEARRLSRALHHFRASCVRLRHERHLSAALQILHVLVQRRPMERIWSRWRTAVRHCQSKAVFGAWATGTRRRRRLRDAMKRVVAAKNRRMVVGILTAWQKKTAASMLVGLSHAWVTIGPVRKALWIMRGMATAARAEKYRRHRRLRKGLTGCFKLLVTDRQNLIATSSCAREHDRKHRLQEGFGTFYHNVAAMALCTRAGEHAAGEYRRQRLHTGIHRWLARHRLAMLVITGKRRISRQKTHASIRSWIKQAELSRATRTLGETRARRTLTSCMMGWKECVVRITTKRRMAEPAAAAFRSSRLRRGVRYWKCRACSHQHRLLLESALSAIVRLRYFRLGFTSLSRWALGASLVRHAVRKRKLRGKADAITRWLEALRATYAIRKASSHHHTRHLSSTLSCWRKGAHRSREQYNMERAGDHIFRKQSLSAGVRLWRRRVRHVSGTYGIVTEFQLHRRHHLGLFGLRRWLEKKTAARLAAWRAGAWAERFCVANALRAWRSRAQRRGDMEVCIRLAEDRRNAGITAYRYRFGLIKRVFVALSDHAHVRSLERRVLAPWSAQVQRAVQADKQVRTIRLRSGLRGLLSWVKLSRHWRDFRLTSLDHRARKVKQNTFGAWKNAVYPLGLRVQWSPSKHAGAGRTMEGRGRRESENERRPHQQTTREDGGLEQTTSATVCSSSLILRRLPMVEKWIRRVLYAWRKIAIKGKRLRYIRDMLPHKMALVPSGTPHGSVMGTDSRVRNLSYQEAPEVAQALNAGDVLQSLGRGRSTYTRHRNRRADFAVGPMIVPPGRATGGSYLQLHLLHSGGKSASATR